MVYTLGGDCHAWSLSSSNHDDDDDDDRPYICIILSGLRFLSLSRRHFFFFLLHYSGCVPCCGRLKKEIYIYIPPEASNSFSYDVKEKYIFSCSKFVNFVLKLQKKNLFIIFIKNFQLRNKIEFRNFAGNVWKKMITGYDILIS